MDFSNLFENVSDLIKKSQSGNFNDDIFCKLGLLQTSRETPS